MKKYVLVFAVVLTLLMSTGARAQKTFPDNPNQGYIDTGMGKGDLISIINAGDTVTTPRLHNMAYSDSLIWQISIEDEQLFQWHINNPDSPVDSLSLVGNPPVDNDIAVTKKYFFAGGVYKDNNGSDNYNLIYRLKENPATAGIISNTQFGKAGKFTELFDVADDSLAIYAYDITNNRVIQIKENQSAGFLMPAEVFLDLVNTDSSQILGLAGLQDYIFVVDGEEDAIHKVDLNGDIVASYAVNTETPVVGKTFELHRPFIEPNGRLTVTMIDTTTHGVENPDQYLLFLTDDLEELDVLEIPADGSKGNYGLIQEVVVDDYGNIYVSDDRSLELKQLEYVNHAPQYNPVEGPKTVLDAANFNHSFYLKPDLFVTDGEDYFDWNENDQLGAIKITDIIGVGGIRYDSDDNGSYETGLIADTEFEFTVEELADSRLWMKFDEDSLAYRNHTKIAFELADLAGEYTGISDTVYINTFKSIFEFDGVQGKDSWQLMAPVIDEVTIEDYLSDLNIPTNNLLRYDFETEVYEPITNMQEVLNAGDAFFVLLPEDNDTSQAGVQGGWPRTDYLDELDRPVFTGSDYMFETTNADLFFDIATTTNRDSTERFGFSIIGNPFGQSWRWNAQFAQKVNLSSDIAIWNPLADSGYGAWEFPTFYGSRDVIIKPGQAFAVFAESDNATLGFKYDGIFTDAVNPVNIPLLINAAPIPKVTVHLHSEDGTGDEFHATSGGRYIVKPLNPSPNNHEIFTLAEGTEISNLQLFSTPQIFDTTGTTIPFSIRSNRVDTALISLHMQHLPEFDSVYVRQVTMNNDTLRYFEVNEYFEIPLVSTKSGYEPEGKLEVVFKNASQLVSKEHNTELPAEFELHQNYPNPFNPTTNIKFSLPQGEHVKLEVFNMLGKKVSTLVDEYKNAGEYSFTINAIGMSSGVYIYRLSSSSSQITRKMTLIR